MTKVATYSVFLALLCLGLTMNHVHAIDRSTHSRYASAKCKSSKAKDHGTSKSKTSMYDDCSDAPSDVPSMAPTMNPGYQIDLRLVNIIDTAPFDLARTRWSDVITHDVEDIELGPGWSDDCGPLPDIIDDLNVCGKYAPLPGNILGYAGPTLFRTANFLPLAGTMVFDKSKVDLYSIDMIAVIMHEMGHIVGLGTMWQYNGLVDSQTAPCSYKPDSNASRQYQAVSGCSGAAIRIENGYGVGNQCSHWDELCFGTELMTGFAASGHMAFSRISIGGLEDMGYNVDYDQADPYTRDELHPTCKCSGLRTRHLLNLDGSTGERRRLSESAATTAIEFGKYILAERSGSTSDVTHVDDISSLEPVLPVEIAAANVVNVMVMENGEYFSVMVTSND